MGRTWSPCARCPEPTPPGTSLCPKCKTQAERDRRPDGNPYNTRGHRAFREQVLARDPICVLCLTARSTVADHYPAERRDLVTQGLNPDDPDRGRGLCASCHNKRTAQDTPGGWNNRLE